MTHDPNHDLFSDGDARELIALARAVSEACTDLASVAEEAAEFQWRAAPIPRPRDDTSERAKGGHSDPTSTIALDDRRLALRAAILGALRDLDKARSRASAAAAHVREALDQWHGGK